MLAARVFQSQPGGALVALALALVAPALRADQPPPLPGEKPGFPLPQHVDQSTVHLRPFAEVYGWGSKLFHAHFNRLDGVGANLELDADVTRRFLRSPNIAKPGYLSPTVKRPGGPEAQNCGGCHTFRSTGSGVVYNVTRDQLRTGDLTRFLNRNTTNLAGSGALQLLAEQTTGELRKLRADALAAAAQSGAPVNVELVNSAGVSFGRLIARPDGSVDTSGVRGVLPDLMVRPYHVKGLVPFLRLQSVVANHVSSGLQGPEVMADPDSDDDGDGVVHEFTVGDHTAVVLYTAALPRPVTRLELHRNLGGKYRLSAAEQARIREGERVFGEVGCASCHTPKYTLRDPIFREPSANIAYRFDAAGFPFFGGGDPLAFGLDYRRPTTFDLRNNPVITCDRDGHGARIEHGGGAPCWRQFESDHHGNAIVRLYGDQKTHDMGPGLEGEMDELGNGTRIWRTRELWGVADTGPWLHDGRATTLPEAIWWHGGEGQEVRDRYLALPAGKQAALIAFLENLVLYRPQDDLGDD